MLMAACCEDDIVPHVLPFVKNNIKHTDWRYRDAAVMAFGEFFFSQKIFFVAQQLFIKVHNSYSTEEKEDAQCLEL